MTQSKRYHCDYLIQEADKNCIFSLSQCSPRTESSCNTSNLRSRVISSCELLSFACFSRKFNLISAKSSLTTSIHSHKRQAIHKAEECGIKALECECIPKGTPSQGSVHQKPQHVSQYPTQDISHSNNQRQPTQETA